MVIRLCFTQELSSFGAVWNAPAGAQDYGPVCSACPSSHAQANWWPQDFASMICWRHSLGLTPPFWMKGLSHKLLFALSFLALYSQPKVIRPHLPNLTNNRGLRNNPEILWSLQHHAGNLVSQTRSWVLGVGGGAKKKKKKIKQISCNQVCRKSSIFRRVWGKLSEMSWGIEGRGGHGPWQHHLLSAVSGWILVSRV